MKTQIEKYDIFLFDLDGTLTDPQEGITNSVKFALKYFGINETDEKKLLEFIGPPLIDSFMEFYGFTLDQAVIAREKYREYYSEKGVFENNLYAGIVDLLKKIKLAGKRMLVATSKPELFANITLKHFGIFEYFEAVCGADMNEKQHKKSDVIRKAVAITQEKDLSKFLMIGDRKHDLIGANEVGIDCVSVLYGYGTKDEFLPFNPKFIVPTVAGLEKLLILN